MCVARQESGPEERRESAHGDTAAASIALRPRDARVRSRPQREDVAHVPEREPTAADAAGNGSREVNTAPASD